MYLRFLNGWKERFLTEQHECSTKDGDISSITQNLLHIAIDKH
jgi:hypothetical protein